MWVRKGKPMWSLANCVEKMEFRVQIDQDSYSSEDREPEKREEGREKSQRWHECRGPRTQTAHERRSPGARPPGLVPASLITSSVTQD